MRENRALTTLKAGGEVVAGWLAIPSSISAELMAKQGFDALTIDLQHGAIDYSDMVPMLQAISTTETTPMVRLPWNDPSIIGRVLDAGAYGVICPMINTGEQARAFVRACRYTPDGERSAGPLRASLYAGSDYIKNANQTIFTMAMVESAESYANLDDILSTPGLDGIYVGPSDLAFSMGESTGFDPRFPAVYDAIIDIAKRTVAKGLIAGIHVGSVQYGQAMREAGYTFQAYLSDFRMMQWAASNALAAFRTGKPVPNAP
jgi:4-hydroxy-2-oxoheptanedioate aldolase